MSRARTALALVGVLALLLGACGDDGEGTAGSSDGTSQAGGPFEVPDGPAATVDSTEVPSTTVEGMYAHVATAPEVSEQLEGEQGAQLATLLRSQILSQLIVKEIVVSAAADDFGIEVSDEDVAERIELLAEQAGGEEQLEEQLAASGISREMLVDLELPLSLTLEQVQAALAETVGDGGTPLPEGEDDPTVQELTPAETALQEWGISRFEAADVVVAPEYGSWNPQRGQVEPDLAE